VSVSCGPAVAFTAIRPSSATDKPTRTNALVLRNVPLVKLNFGDREQTRPLWLVAEALFERALGILFAEEEIDRLRVSEFDERVRAHERSLERCRRHRYCRNQPSPQRHPRMTSQGTPRGRFQRAIHARHVQNAEMAAREMGVLSLADALLLCELLAKTDVARYERAALRWLQRFIDERLPPLTEVALAASALAELHHGTRNTGIDTLKRLLRHG
jgi:hypothetical protein